MVPGSDGRQERGGQELEEGDGSFSFAVVTAVDLLQC